jgi:hypothetical protein
MTSQGTAHGRFTRAIQQRNLWAAEMSLREIGGVSLEVYTKVMERTRDTGIRMDALIRGADWAQMGTNGAEAVDPASTLATENPAGAGLF